jgi:DNA-nicking Smr family endonuclease
VTRSGRGSGKPSRGLSPEDDALWSFVADTTEPLRRAKPRVPSHESLDERPRAPALPNRKPARPAAPDTTRSRPQRLPPLPAAPAKAPPLAAFDRKKAKKLASGRETIDARIDLHGMRQSEAHNALRGFLIGCHADGKRNVLIITGKGGSVGEDDANRPFAMNVKERGVLRRNVPMWLAEPDLRAIVVSFRDAGRGHGGAGALYVHLRARRKA